MVYSFEEFIEHVGTLKSISKVRPWPPLGLTLLHDSRSCYDSIFRRSISPERRHLGSERGYMDSAITTCGRGAGKCWVFTLVMSEFVAATCWLM